MPSLRRSLIVYFLLLLLTGLGTVAVLSERVTDRALSEKERATVDLSDRLAADRVAEVNEKFNAALLAQAKVVARTAGTEYIARMEVANRRFAVYQDAPTVGLMLGGAGEPHGWLAAATWETLSHFPPPGRRNPPGPAFNLLAQFNYANLRFEDYLIDHLDDEIRSGDFIQIHHSNRGPGPNPPWRSANLGAYTMPFNRTQWDAEGENFRFDEVTLPAGRARRVTFKTAPFGVGGVTRGGPQRDTAGSTRDGAAPPPQPRYDSNVWFPRSYIHVARLTAAMDADLAEIRAARDQQRADLAASTADWRRWVRWMLAGSCGLAFLGVLVGGRVLIGHGLAPLRKLSDAVSRVSEKDFRLPVEKEELNQELLPIHDRLTHSLEALKRAFEREKEAVADISHELRTPVAGLLATIDVALRKPRTAEQYKQTLEDCRGITKQLGGLVERVMTLAYLDAGQATVNDAPTDAAHLAADCAAVIRPLAESHGLTFRVFADEPAELTTDADKLREVMINLLHNAVEYNRPGGDITLSVQPDEAGRVVVAVADTGIGMTPEVRGKIFERFYRADPSRTATGVHAGLGLAIVKEYVDRLGGTISVESEPDRGSTFRVSLPA
jgi:signal transduction histidine kinase